MLEVFFEKYKPCLLAKNHDCKNGVGKETENSVKHSKTKRVNNLYAKIYELDNLILADEKARKGKKLSHGVKVHDRNGNASVYVIEMYNEDERFVKIGITYKSVNERFLNTHCPYKFNILYLYSDSPECVYDTEEELHKQFKEYSYNPNIYFAGHTECFNMFVLDEIKKMDLFKIAV